MTAGAVGGGRRQWESNGGLAAQASAAIVVAAAFGVKGLDALGPRTVALALGLLRPTQ